MNEGQSYEYNAKTVEAAVDEGLRQLGVSREEIEIEVINEGSRGILGIGSSDALVRLTRRDTDEPSEAQARDDGEEVEEVGVEARTEPEETAEIVSDDAPAGVSTAESDSYTVDVESDPDPTEDTQLGIDAEGDADDAELEDAELEDAELEDAELEDAELEDLAFDLLNQMLVHMGITAEIEVSWQESAEDSDRALSLNVVGEDLGFLIGRNGETLASMQYLIRLMVNQELHRWKNIVIDIDGYKQRRAEQLSQLAHRLAEQVVATGRAASLEPMPPSERRLVHIALRDHEHVYTASTGEDTRRKVQILLK